MLEGDYLNLLYANGSDIPNVFAVVVAPMVEVMGEAVLYSWFAFMTFSMLYLKGQKVEIPAVVSLVFGVAALQYLPSSVHGVAILLIALASSSLIYRAFRSRD